MIKGLAIALTCFAALTIVPITLVLSGDRGA